MAVYYVLLFIPLVMFYVAVKLFRLFSISDSNVSLFMSKEEFDWKSLAGITFPFHIKLLNDFFYLRAEMEVAKLPIKHEDSGDLGLPVFIEDETTYGYSWMSDKTLQRCYRELVTGNFLCDMDVAYLNYESLLRWLDLQMTTRVHMKRFLPNVAISLEGDVSIQLVKQENPTPCHILVFSWGWKEVDVAVAEDGTLLELLTVREKVRRNLSSWI